MRVTVDKKVATRERLLAAAAQEFGRVGLERASIDHISLAAGFAKGTVYNYFASKEELFLAVVEEASAQAAAAAATAPADATARERLELTLAGFCAWARDHDAFARVLVRECLMGTPGLYPRVVIAETPLVAALETIVREGAHSGELRGDLPADLLALALAGLADLALAQHWASGGTKPTIEEIPELVLSLLLAASEEGVNLRPPVPGSAHPLAAHPGCGGRS
jgi:AcrR family transcriptional regulator